MTFVPYSASAGKASMLPKSLHLKGLALASIAMLSALLMLAFPGKLSAQATDDYEEISVFLAVQGIGGYDITAIYKDDEIYLPVSEMFRCLKINNRISDFNDTISGFFLDEKNTYLISQPGHTIFIDGKLVQLTEKELLNTETTSLALRLDQYGKLFGLTCRFNFSSLSVELTTSHELPVIKELRLEQMRKNISRLRGEIKVDTTYPRKYHIFRGGMADWALYSTQVTGGKTETRAMLGLGAEFLGGETNIELNYSTLNKFDKRQQQYHWRWANNDTKLVKQVIVGKISSRSIASIYSPLIGTVITNTPTSFRRSFGSYTMSDFTEPGWTVELYINNVVVDFTTADASGFYKFDIPLVYGSSSVLVKFYGPWGEERQKEQRINVPYNFLPKGEIQYMLTGAMVQDTNHSVFTRGEVNFGINRHITLGGGYEYLSSITAAPSTPFVTGSAQVFTNLLLNAEYAYGVRTKALLSYTLPSNFVFDVDYTKYETEQKAITFNYLEERKVRVSIPITLKKVKAYSRFSYIQNILKETNYSTAEATLSTFYNGVSANFTGNANWLGSSDPYIYGNLALGFRFFRTLSFRPQVQYDFSNKDVIFTKVELENNFSPKCNLSLIWENNVRSNINTVELTFRYDLSFVQTSLSTRVSKNYVMTGQSARGSFAFGSGNGRIIADKRTQVGRAGLTVIPFLDINNNNHRDDNEPLTSGMNLRINGGRILPDTRDSIIRILELEPFASYMLEFSDTQFDNIAWQIQNKTISILMDPNQFKLLEIPVKVMGEINGMIYIKTGSSLRAQGRVQVNVFDMKGNFVAKTQSESDGYFTYLGLAPGKYYVEIDSLQLSRLKSMPDPARFEFEIKASAIGDIIDNIQLQLVRMNPDKLSTKVNESMAIEPKAKPEITPVIKSEIPPIAKEIEKAKPVVTNTVVANEPIDIIKTATEAYKYYIQAGAFEDKTNAQKLANELRMLTNENWFIVSEDGLYKVRLGYFASKQAAKSYENTLTTPGIYYYINKVRFDTEPEKLFENNTKSQVTPVTPGNTSKDGLTPTVPATNFKVESDEQGFFVQAGAFKIQKNAEDLLHDLLVLTPNKWFIVYQNGFHKVRLGYFETKEEAKNIEKSLNYPDIAYYVNQSKSAGITQPAQDQNQKKQSVAVPSPEVKEPVVAAKKQEEPKVKKADAVMIPPVKKEVLPETKKTEKPGPQDAIVLTPPIENIANLTDLHKYYIQAGAVQSKSKAEELVSDLLRLTLKRWFIVYEDGLYKVRLGYFSSKEGAKYIAGTMNTTDVEYYIGESHP